MKKSVIDGSQQAANEMCQKVNAKVLPHPSPAKQHPQCHPQFKFQTQHLQGQVKPKKIDGQQLQEGRRGEQRIQTEIKNSYQFIRLSKRLVESINNELPQRNQQTAEDKAMLVAPATTTQLSARPVSIRPNAQIVMSGRGDSKVLGLKEEEDLVDEGEEVLYDSLEFDSALEVDVEDMIDVDEGIGPQRAGRLSETHMNKMKHAFKSQSLSGNREKETKNSRPSKYSNGIVVSQINLRAVQTNAQKMSESNNFDFGNKSKQLPFSESVKPFAKTLKKNSTHEQIVLEKKKHNFLPVNANMIQQKTGGGAVNTTKFGPIGQVGNCQIGGFGKSLNAMMPSTQPYLRGQSQQTLNSQFCILSPKVIPINNASSENISPVGASPDNPDDMLESPAKEIQPYQPNTTEGATSGIQISSGHKSISQRDLRSPKTSKKVEKKKTLPLKNISNDLDPTNVRGKEEIRSRNVNTKQKANGQFEKTNQKSKKSKGESDLENPYTPSQKTNSRRKKKKETQVTSATQKLIHQSQKCTKRKQELKCEANNTAKNSLRKNNFISDQLKVKGITGNNEISSPKAFTNHQLVRKKYEEPTYQDEKEKNERNEIGGAAMSMRRSSHQVSLQEGQLDMSSGKKTIGEKADIGNNCTAIKHEGIKNDISQFQIKVTRIQNEADSQSYDFENKVKQKIVSNRCDNKWSKPEYVGYNMQQRSNRVELRRFSMKESKDYQQMIQTQHNRKSDPEGKIVLEPQTSSDLVRSDSKPSLIASTNRSSKRLTEEPPTQAATNRKNIPNIQENRASFLQARQYDLQTSQNCHRRRRVDQSTERSNSVEQTMPPSPLSQQPMPHSKAKMPDPPTTQSQHPRRQMMCSHDYFKVSTNKKDDGEIGEQVDQINSQTDNADDANMNSDGGGLIATEGSLRPIVDPRTNNANTNVVLSENRTNAFNYYMQTSEEQGNAKDDCAVPAGQVARDDNLTLGSQPISHNFTTTQQQASYQVTTTFLQAGSRGKDRRATSKESVERAERFKMNSRKSQDILAAIKDSADKTARKIKNVSLTRRRYPGQFKPNNADIEQVTTLAAPAKMSTALSHANESRLQIQRYQSQQQLMSGTYARKIENNHIHNARPDIAKSSMTTHGKQNQKSGQKNQQAKKQKKTVTNSKVVGQVQIKLENITGMAPQSNEQTGQQAPEQSGQHEQAQRVKLQDNSGDNADLQTAHPTNSDTQNAQIIKGNGRPTLQSKTTRNEQSYRVPEKWINQNRSEINLIQEQIAAALTQTSHLIRNQRALDRHDRDYMSRSNSKQTLMRSGTESQIRQRAVNQHVISQQNLANGKQIQSRDNQVRNRDQQQEKASTMLPHRGTVIDNLTVEEQLMLINDGRPVVVNLQLKKPTLINQKSHKVEDRMVKLAGQQQAASAMEFQQSKHSALNFKDIRDQRAGAKSPQLVFSANAQQRFQRKASQPLLRTQSMHKFRNNKTSFGCPNGQQKATPQECSVTRNLKSNKSANIANFYQTLPYKTGKQQIMQNHNGADSSLSRHVFNRDIHDCSSILLDQCQNGDGSLKKLADLRRNTDYHNKLIASVHIERLPRVAAADEQQYISRRNDFGTDVSMIERSRLNQSGTRRYDFQQQLKPRGSSLALSRRAQSRQQYPPPTEPRPQTDHMAQSSERTHH